MSSEDNSPAPTGKRARGGDKPPTPRPQVPKHARIWLSVGTFAGLFCAEAMSSMRLFSLGERAGYAPFLAWLLPGALDVYALTLVWFFSNLPAEHPLRAKAAREAALALGITVLCNALDEIVEAFASQLPYWAPRILFVFVSALAPFVAYRLIHFRAEIGNDAARESIVADAQKSTAKPKAAAPIDGQGKTTTAGVGDGRGGPADADDANRRPPLPADDDGVTTTAKPAATTAGDEVEKVATVTNLNDRRRSDDDWARIAAPHYRAFTRLHDGKTPSGPKLAELLEGAGHERLSDSRAREIRRATERHLEDNPNEETERAGWAAS